MKSEGLTPSFAPELPVTYQKIFESIYDDLTEAFSDVKSFGIAINVLFKVLAKHGYNRIRYFSCNYNQVWGKMVYVARYSYGMKNNDVTGLIIYEDEGLLEQERNADIFLGEERAQMKPKSAPWIKRLDMMSTISISVPLLLGTKIAGVLSVDNLGAERQLNRHDLGIFSRLAILISLTLHSIRTIENLILLNDIHTLVNQDASSENKLIRIIKSIGEKFQACISSLFVYDYTERQLVNVATWILNCDEKIDFKEKYEVGSYIVGKVFRENIKINVLDFVEYKNYVGSICQDFMELYVKFAKAHGLGDIGIWNGIFIPIAVEGQPIGVIRLVDNLDFQRNIPFCDDDLDLLSIIGLGMAPHIQNLQMYSAISKITNRLMEVFYADGLAEALDCFVSDTRELLDAELSSVFLMENERLILRTESQKGGGLSRPMRVFDLGAMGLTRFIASSSSYAPLALCGEELRTHEYVIEKGCINQNWIPSGTAFTMLACPIKEPQGELLGVIKYFNKLHIYERKPGDNIKFNEYDRQTVDVLKNKLGDLIVISRLTDAIDNTNFELSQISQIVGLSELTDGTIHDTNENLLLINQQLYRIYDRLEKATKEKNLGELSGILKSLKDTKDFCVNTSETVQNLLNTFKYSKSEPKANIDVNYLIKKKLAVYNGPQNLDSVISYTWEIKGGGPSGTNAKEVSAFI